MERFIYGQDTFLSLIVIFFAICLSDLLDGKIARKTGFVSTIGAKLDVSADLLYILLSYVALIILKILPLWFLGFVCFKFIEFIVTSRFIKLYNKSSNSPFIFDKIGRIVSAVFFIIPGAACILKCLMSYNAEYFISSLICITTAAGLCSSCLRIKNCFILVALNTAKG
jgi:Phosphatidylglycerophosphate synthase